MLLDAAVVFGLSVWEKKLKQERDLAEREADIQHETTKKASRAQKAASRQQRKVEEKKNLNGGSQASFVPKQHIQQPDKNKKSR
jgi:hypothetical protein